MAYVTSPYAPRARKLAVNLLRRERLSYAEVARRVGVNRSTIMRWNKKASKHSGEYIPTLLSAPKTHPNRIDRKIVKRIVELRAELKRPAPVIHQRLLAEGQSISLSSVERTLKRLRLTRKKRWVEEHQTSEACKAGSIATLSITIKLEYTLD
jgi:transposase